MPRATWGPSRLPMQGQPPDGHPSDRAAERERPLDALERLPKALVISSSSWPNSGYLLTMSSRDVDDHGMRRLREVGHVRDPPLRHVDQEVAAELR